MTRWFEKVFTIEKPPDRNAAITACSSVASAAVGFNEHVPVFAGQRGTHRKAYHVETGLSGDAHQLGWRSLDQAAMSERKQAIDP